MALDFLIGVLEGVRDGTPLDQTLALCAFVGLLTLPAGALYARYNRGVNTLKEKNAEFSREARELRRDRDRLKRKVDGLTS